MEKLKLRKGLFITGIALFFCLYTTFLIGLTIRVNRLEKIQEYYESQEENISFFDFFKDK